MTTFSVAIKEISNCFSLHTMELCFRKLMNFTLKFQIQVAKVHCIGKNLLFKIPCTYYVVKFSVNVNNCGIFNQSQFIDQLKSVIGVI